MEIYGNEHANTGQLRLTGGLVSGGDVQIYTGTGSTVLQMDIDDGGLVGIGTTVHSSQLSVDQTSSSAGIPVLQLDQGDIDDTFINYIGTSAADGSRSISSDTTENGAKFGAIRCEINGTTKWIRIYDDHS